MIRDNFCVANTTEGCGYGTCTPTGDWCTCNEGYTHDFTWIMCQNCYLPSALRTPMLAVLALFSFIVGCWVIQQTKGTIGIPRKLCLASSLVSFTNMAMMIAEIIEGRPGRLTILFELVFVSICATYLLPLFLYSILSPVLDMTGKGLEKRFILQVIQLSGAFYLSVFVSYYIAACIYVDNLALWNILFQSISVFLSVYMIVLCLFIRFWFLKLIFHLEKIESSFQSNETQLVRYKETLKTSVFRLSLAMFPICLGLIGFAIVYFSYGCFPYLYVLFFMMHFTPNVFCITFVSFTKLKKKGGSSSNSKNGTVMVMSTSSKDGGLS